MLPRNINFSSMTIMKDGKKVQEIHPGGLIYDINISANEAEVPQESFDLLNTEGFEIRLKPPEQLNKLMHILKHAKSGRVRKKQAVRIEKECGLLWLFPFSSVN